MTDVINAQDLEKTEQTASVNKESTFTELLNLHNTSVATAKARLLLTKPPVHKVDAGLNPLVDAAAHIFTLIGKLSRTRAHENLLELHRELFDEIQDFKEAIQTLNYPPENIGEYTLISTYILCTTLDDIITNTPCGGPDQWQKYSLRTAYNQDALSRESFLIILERFIQEPNIYIDIMEFIYISLSLGFKYNFHSTGFNVEQLQKIMYSLYKHIRAYRGTVNKSLSPFPVKPIQPTYFKQNWKTKIAKGIARKLTRKKQSFKSMAMYPVLVERLHNVEIRFRNVVHFLNTKTIKIKGNKVKLNTLPWVLFVGSTGAGKTSLIENSHIKFIVNRKSEHKDGKPIIDHSENWDWWVTSESVLIDVPGAYLPYHKHEGLTSKPWEYFLDLIEHERGKYGLNGVTLVLSYAEIMDKANREHLVSDLSLRINDLRNKFGNQLPFYLVVTKCDLMPGFLEFFANDSNDELSQIWGARLPHPSLTQTMIDVFHARFNAVIKQINNQLIYRLQQENDFDSYAKFRIKDFPLQVESLKENLSDVIKKIMREDSYFLLKGFYMTSALQSPVNEHTSGLPQVISNNSLLQSLSIMEPPKFSVQSYFIKQLLLYGLITDQNSIVIQHQLKHNNLLDILHKTP